MTSARARLAASVFASLRHGALQATLVYALLIGLFLSTPLARYGEVHYSSADLMQDFGLTRVESVQRAGNPLQSDAVTQMQPWLMFNRAELAEGRFPLWNPWNGAGCPHFANYQSAVVSPFSVPFYVLSFKAALLASAALKLLSLALFTYLFLRKLGLAHAAALFGGVAFAFAGHNVLLLYFPHVGAMVALPAGCLAIEVAAQRTRRAIESGAHQPLFAPLAGLTAAFGVGLLAGNPEPFYFSALFVAAFTVARLAGLWIDLRAIPRAQARIAAFASQAFFAAALAAGLTAFQVLPFFEFLDLSRVYEERSSTQTPLDPAMWPLALFPDALGNPSLPYQISIEVPPPNYELVNVAYSGGTALFLALLAGAFAVRDRKARFFVLAGAVWLVYAYDFFGAAKLFALLPTVDMAPMNRSQGVWNFVVACAAAVFLDRAARRAGRREWLGACAIVAAAGVMLVASLIGIDRLIERFASVPTPHRDLFRAFVPPHLRDMSVLFGVGALAAALLWLARASWQRNLLASAALAASFASTGWTWRDYNPVCEDRFFFPRTAAITELARIVGNERVAILGEDTIPPDANLPYGLSLIANYDGMWVRDYDHLYRDQFGDTHNWRPVLRASERALRTFGVSYVLAKWGWNEVDNGLAEFGRARGQAPLRHEIVPNQPLTQTFRSRRNGLRTVMVYLGAPVAGPPCTAQIEVVEVATGRVVVQRTVEVEELRRSLYAGPWIRWPYSLALDPRGRPYVVHFDPIADSAGKDYELRLTSSDALKGGAIVAWSLPLNAYGDGEAKRAGRRLPGEVLFDFSSATGGFEEVAILGDFTLYRMKEPMPRYALVNEAVEFDSRERVLDMLRSPSFDPRRRVVLEKEAGAPAAAVVRRRVVQFSDHDWVYLVGPDGRSLVHIDDEATFLANEFLWNQIEKLPPSARADFVFVPDDDREAKQRAGLRLVTPESPFMPQPKVLEETPTRIRLEVERLQTGYLVVAQTYFPGWKARLDGVEAPLLRANYAFSAVQIPPGRFEVELSYEPDSLRIGLWIGAASLAAGVLAWALSWRAGRGRTRLPTPGESITL